jgi:endoglucanase
MRIEIARALNYQAQLTTADQDHNGYIDSEAELQAALREILNGQTIKSLPHKYQKLLQNLDKQSLGSGHGNEIIDANEVAQAVKLLQEQQANQELLLAEFIFDEDFAREYLQENNVATFIDKTTEKINIPITNVLEIGWKDKPPRLKTQLIPNGFRLYDPAGAEYTDSAMFNLAINRPLPYGEKLLSFSVTIQEGHTPLWGKKLFEVLLNGKELEAADFILDVGSDGKGFVPSKTGRFTFIIPNDVEQLGILSFMTAGAKAYNVSISDIVIGTTPKTSEKKQRLVLGYNQIGYAADNTKTALLQGALPADVAFDFFLKDTSNTIIYTGKTSQSKQDVLSGDFTASLNFSELKLTGEYTLVIPDQTGIREPITQAITIKENITKTYGPLRNSVLKAFTLFTCGEHSIYGINDHAQDKAAHVYGEAKTIDISGGWHDAGDYGKYSVNGGYSVGLLLVTQKYLSKGFRYDIGLFPSKSVARPDYLSITLEELQFLQKMQRPDGGCFHKAATADWPAANVTPEADQTVKTVLPVSTTATADIAASLALGFTIYKNANDPADRKLAETFLVSAEKAWDFLIANPQLIMIKDSYEDKVYGGAYSDSKDRDERLWAAVELFNATGKEKYQNYINQAVSDIFISTSLSRDIPDWANVNFLALFSYIRSPNADTNLVKVIKNNIIAYAETLLEKQTTNTYGLTFGGPGNSFVWGSNGIVATTGLELLFAYQLIGDKRYQAAALHIADYLLGLNPQGLSYVVGEGSQTAHQPHYRPSMSGKYAPPQGMLVGGPNNSDTGGDILAQAINQLPPLRVYLDEQDSWSTNEVAINWQATLAAFLSLLCEE